MALLRFLATLAYGQEQVRWYCSRCGGHYPQSHFEDGH